MPCSRWLSHFFSRVKEGVILHQMQVKPSYATILKKGRKSAPPVRGYLLAAAALSRMKTQSAPPAKRGTTDLKKLYLDSAATYHIMFITWYLRNVRNAGKTIRGHCNAGVKLCTKVGDLGVFKMWINEGGVANLLLIPQLEKDGFRMTSDTHGEWIVYSPRGEKIFFQERLWEPQEHALH